MRCKHCGREVVKSPYIEEHPNGFMHRDVPNWNCRQLPSGKWSKEFVEPFIFNDYLKEIEK